jgi:hypothetical protein
MGIFQVRQQRLEPVTKPVIIKVGSEYINNEVSISNKISEIFYMYGGRLLVHEEILKENHMTTRTLFTSSDNSWTREGFGYGPIDDTPPAKEDILKKQPFGILVEGKFKAKYVDQDVPKWSQEPGAVEDTTEETESALASEITGEAKENKVIAFGCSNMFKSDVLGAVASHKALLLNSVDALTLGDELINVRSKAIAARRIQATSTMGKTMAKAFVVWFPPLVFIALGVVLNIKRKQR